MSIPRRLALGLALAMLASLASPVHAVAAAAGGTSTGDPGLPCASPLVADPVGGAAAVRELGTDLPEAAANIDRSPAQYRALLRSDATLRVDECGQTFVVEPAMTSTELSAAASADDVPAAGAGLDTSGDAFTLNSRPGSQRTIFLDFDGQDVSGTGWNRIHADVVAAPYDTDGLAGLGTTEQNAIRNIWLRVAEDYAPFDVNVTTQDPGQAAITRDTSADQQYGTRALITMDTVLWADLCASSCGGIAYIGAFDDWNKHDYYQPALVFQRGLLGVSASAKSIAEAVSHEVGHNLGLNHDGKTGAGATGYYGGQGAWAPIMGVGYYEPVTQWSQGEYTGADNHQDDIAVMASNGVNPIADDHADSATSATTLTYAGPAVDGLIGTRTDTDWFSFTVPAGAGTTSVLVTPQTVAGDLDASLTVYDSAGTIAAAADPPVVMGNRDQATGLDAAVTQTLAPGTYTAKVDGVGFDTAAGTGYSDYASLGRYSIIVGGPGTSTPPPTPSSPPTPTAPPTPTPTSPLPPTPTVTTPIPTTPIPPTTRPGGPAQPSIWTGSLRAAVSALALRSETPTGFSVARFPVVDADHDCRSTRTEVLAAESWRTMSWTNARHCTVRTGGWFSLFDRRRAFSASQVTAVWTVPLTEAWRSGARSWPAARRQAYANDLADPRTLLAVTTRSARSRADREPQSWLPAPASRCAYVAQWVAVKLRWALSVDRVEQAHLASLATSCPATRLTVHRA